MKLGKKSSYIPHDALPSQEMSRRLDDGLVVETFHIGPADPFLTRQIVASWFSGVFKEKIAWWHRTYEIDGHNQGSHRHVWLPRTKDQAAMLKARFG